MKLIPKSQDAKENALFKKHGLECHVNRNEITLYSNDWASCYQIYLKGKKPRLALLMKDEKCYR